MASFGRRVVSVQSVSQLAEAKLRLSDRSFGRAWLATAFLTATAIGVPVWNLARDSQLPIPRDRSPGAQFPTFPYVLPPGCPDRVWEVGDYLPGACLYDAGMSQPERVGLEAPPPVRGRGMFAPLRRQRWVRARSDALLIAGRNVGGGEIRAIVRNRFVPTAPERPAAFEPDARDYKQPPQAYLISRWSILLGGPALLLLSLPFLWACVLSHARKARLAATPDEG